MPGEAIKKGSIQMKKSFFLIMAKLCPLKSVDFKQFYNSVVWKKKVFAYKSTGSFNVSCHLNNSISSRKKIISKGKKKIYSSLKPQIQSPTKLLMNVLLV